MWLCILAYIVLTGLAIYYAEDEGVFKYDSIWEFSIRMFFLLTIGWLFAICGLIGGCLCWFALIVGEQTIGVQLHQEYGERFFFIPWAGKKAGRFIKKLFTRKKKVETEPCMNDSQTEQEKS